MRLLHKCSPQEVAPPLTRGRGTSSTSISLVVGSQPSDLPQEGGLWPEEGEAPPEVRWRSGGGRGGGGGTSSWGDVKTPPPDSLNLFMGAVGQIKEKQAFVFDLIRSENVNGALTFRRRFTEGIPRLPPSSTGAMG